MERRNPSRYDSRTEHRPLFCASFGYWGGRMKDTKRITFLYPYTPATIILLEKWLCKMAASGWRLERKSGWKFVFRKCKPYSTQYFYYSSFGTNLGIYYDYCQCKRRYSHSGSIINKLPSSIFEVDIEKIDADFSGYVYLRNKFYKKHYVGLLIYSLIHTVLALSLAISKAFLYIFVFIGVLLFVYSLYAIIAFSLAHKT